MSNPKFPENSVGSQILENGNSQELNRKLRKGTGLTIQDEANHLSGN